jgi:hypothetical protein
MQKDQNIMKEQLSRIQASSSSSSASSSYVDVLKESNLNAQAEFRDIVDNNNNNNDNNNDDNNDGDDIVEDGYQDTYTHKRKSKSSRTPWTADIDLTDEIMKVQQSRGISPHTFDTRSYICIYTASSIQSRCTYILKKI